MKRPTSVVGRHVSVYNNVCKANSPATKGNCNERVSEKPCRLLSANCRLADGQHSEIFHWSVGMSLVTIIIIIVLPYLLSNH